MSQHNYFIGVWMSGSFYRVRERGGWGSKKVTSLGNISWNGQPQREDGCVNFFPPVTIHKWTGSGCFLKQRHFWFNIQTEGQGSLRQAIMYTQHPFTKQKQQEAKVKVRETSQQGVRFLFFPVTHAGWLQWGKGHCPCSCVYQPLLVITEERGWGDVMGFIQIFRGVPRHSIQKKFLLI